METDAPPAKPIDRMQKARDALAKIRKRKREDDVAASSLTLVPVPTAPVPTKTIPQYEDEPIMEIESEEPSFEEPPIKKRRQVNVNYEDPQFSNMIKSHFKQKNSFETARDELGVLVTDTLPPYINTGARYVGRNLLIGGAFLGAYFIRNTFQSYALGKINGYMQPHIPVHNELPPQVLSPQRPESGEPVPEMRPNVNNKLYFR